MTTAACLVLQSHRDPLPYAFLEPCLESVRQWAHRRGYAYRFLGDELFESLDPHVLHQTRQQPVIATDLGRLQWLQKSLSAGYGCVIWLDADTLVLDADRFVLPAHPFVLGRETWVQDHAGRPRLYSKVHNALIMARTGNVELPFYAQTALRMVARHTGHMPPQFVGPKLLSALHSLADFSVIETANVLPPLVGRDMIAGSGAYLDAYRSALPQAPAALNMCTSSVARGELTVAEMQRLVRDLAQQPEIFAIGG